MAVFQSAEEGLCAVCKRAGLRKMLLQTVGFGEKVEIC